MGDRIDVALGRCGLMTANRIRARSEARNQRITADAVARLLWDARANLKIKRVNSDYGSTTDANPEWDLERDVRLPEMELPGGTVLRITKCVMEEEQKHRGFGMVCKVQYSITTSTGIVCKLMRSAATGLDETWYTIVSDAIVDTLAPSAFEPHPKPDARSAQRRLTDLLRSILLHRDRDEGGKRDELHRAYHTGSSGPYRERSLWRGVGAGIEIHISNRFRDDPECALVSHPLFGSIELPHAPIAMSIEQRSYGIIADGLGIARLPSHTVPTPTGNARAARVMRIARDAVASFPDLRDASGTEIAPLVHKHLPNLLRRHADASAAAPAGEMERIDADLDEGLEAVRAAVEEALAVESGQRRDALRTEIAFLKARHPSRETVLRSIGGGGAERDRIAV